MNDFSAWKADDAARHIAVPRRDDDKYTRGVLGIITGSEQYPGAAVIGVEAALRTGVGMVRYRGPRRAEDLVLQRRPEAVVGEGRVQAWLIGSGMDHAARDEETRAMTEEAVAQGVPVVLDGGAIDLCEHASGPVIITPHYGELARLLDEDAGRIAAEPGEWAVRSADQLGVTVLLKGNTTYIAGPGIALSATHAPTWLATAGAGDALGGILGALVATHSDRVLEDATLLAQLGATASLLHGLAAAKASRGGPLTVLDLAAAVPGTIVGLLSSPLVQR